MDRIPLRIPLNVERPVAGKGERESPGVTQEAILIQSLRGLLNKPQTPARRAAVRVIVKRLNREIFLDF